MSVEELGTATSIPLAEAVEAAAGDAEEGDGLLGSAEGCCNLALSCPLLHGIEHLQVEEGGQFSDTRSEVGTHQVSGGGEVGAVCGERSAEAIAHKEGGAVHGLHMSIEGGVAGDDSVEVSEFVEDGGEEVIATEGRGAWGGFGGGVGER